MPEFCFWKETAFEQTFFSRDFSIEGLSSTMADTIRLECIKHSNCFNVFQKFTATLFCESNQIFSSDFYYLKFAFAA